jgi:superfamily II DNA or RNA helicase
VKEVKHGEILSNLCSLPFVHGSSDDRSVIAEFNNQHCKTLIGTTGVLGEGVDTKPCEYVVIAGLGKAKSHFMQQIGRSVRKFDGKESAKVILIKDRSHRFCSRHFAIQCRILKNEYDVIPVKLEV